MLGEKKNQHLDAKTGRGKSLKIQWLNNIHSFIFENTILKLFMYMFL